MQIRFVATALNGALVLALYVTGWGVPNFSAALLEVALGVAAGPSTWYALRRLATPIARLVSWFDSDSAPV